MKARKFRDSSEYLQCVQNVLGKSPVHAASHFDHKKRVAWVPISMHTCGSFFYNYGTQRDCSEEKFTTVPYRCVAVNSPVSNSP